MPLSKKLLALLFAAAIALAASWWLFQPNSSDLPSQPLAAAPKAAPPAIVAVPPAANPITSPLPVASRPPIPSPSAPPAVPAVAAAGEPSFTPPASPPPDMNDLGTIEFTDGVPLTVNLEQGRTCTVTPKVLPNGTLQLSMAIEEPGDQPGTTNTLSTPTVITRPGQSVSVSVSSTGMSLGVSLTPMLKGE